MQAKKLGAAAVHFIVDADTVQLEDGHGMALIDRAGGKGRLYTSALGIHMCRSHHGRARIAAFPRTQTSG